MRKDAPKSSKASAGDDVDWNSLLATLRPVSRQMWTVSNTSVIDEEAKKVTKDLRDFFGVNPGFSFYDDGDDITANAMADPHVLPGQGTDGTVLLGLHLIARYVTRLDRVVGSAPFELFVILAHEFGHILQFKENIVASWEMEPHAD